MVVPFTGRGDAEEGTALGLLDQESSLVITEMLVTQGGNKMNYFREVERSHGGVIPLAVVSIEIILKARWLAEITRG